MSCGQLIKTADLFSTLSNTMRALHLPITPVVFASHDEHAAYFGNSTFATSKSCAGRPVSNRPGCKLTFESVVSADSQFVDSSNTTTANGTPAMTSNEALVACGRHVDRRNGSLLLLSAVLLWGASVAVGFAAFMNYETTAGAPGDPGELWPANSRLQRTPGQFSIVMVAHPRCPCTRASLATLRELSEYCRSRATIDVLFWMPRDAGPEWSQTVLWRDATAISAARVHPDIAGLEAQRFGAATSGQVLVFDATGQCVFRGGITNSRGKFGDSDGANAIRNLISSPIPTHTKTPVFGCPVCHSQAPGDQKAHRVLNCR